MTLQRYTHEVNLCELTNSPERSPKWIPCTVKDSNPRTGQTYIQPRDGSPLWVWTKNVRKIAG